MKKICCVILNYNDYENTVTLVNFISNFMIFDNIVIVDNASTDNSLEELNKLKSGKVAVYKNDKNGGYGYGYNFGIKMAKEKFNADLALTVNPDVRFTEKCIEAMINTFSIDDNCAMVSAVQMLDGEKIVVESAWNIPSVWQYIFSAGIILRQFYKPFKIEYDKDMQYCDCVIGGFTMIDICKFFDAGGYDDRMFLNCEEVCLGIRLKRAGYKTILLPKYNYSHFHSSGSISKGFANKAFKYKKTWLTNRLFIIENYMTTNKMIILIAKIFYQIAALEGLIKGLILSVCKYKN